jgi:hypothetical protein
MSKCIYCKKYGKDQYRCEITKVIRRGACRVTPCKYFKLSLFGRFANWFYEH